MKRTPTRRLFATIWSLMAVVLATSACTSDELADTDGGVESADDGETVDEFESDDLGSDDGQSETVGDDIDLSLTRDDVDCSAEAVGGGDIEFSVVHVVVDGVLGETCLGTEDETLYAAWEILAVIAPTTARADLALFGGFAIPNEGDEVTLAFVNPVDDDGTVFQMSISLPTFEEDENESYLTMAHEFSHVFTLLPSQIDRAILPEECDTFDNGEGCFYDDALMAQWVDEFWTDDMLSTFDPNEEASGEAGAPRCDRNPEFLGAYAASSPDEDFAETFSAFVFELEVDPAMDPKIEWMAAQPGLVEFRDRAIDAGFTPLANNFDRCG